MISNTWRRITYTFLAPLYDVVVQPLSSKRKRSVGTLAPRTGERVLVIGAGTGLDLPLIPEGCLVTAIDLTPAMMDRLVARASRLGRRVDARVMDAQELDFKDGCFDAVILHLILAVVPDPGKTLREASRVLRKGGRAVVLDKFAPDGRKPPLLLRLASPVARFIATEVTRQLQPLLNEVPELHVVRNEPAGLGGFFRIVLLSKSPGEEVTGKGRW